MLRRKVFRKAVTATGLALFFLPAPNPLSGFISRVLPCLHAQRFPDRMRRPIMPSGVRPAGAPAGQPVPTAPAAPQPATPGGAQSLAQPPPSAAPASLPPSMLNQPAQPAEIHFTATTLSIHADNSSLHEILSTISTQSGMTFQGLGSDERVFGSFGPGTPREVLSDLLNGTPYNILMVGDLSDGAPRQLILTPNTSSADFSPGVSPRPSANTENAQAGGEPSDSGDNTEPAQPKTPQELYQELQNLRQHPPQPQ